jgi:hypothetical protein
VILHIRPPFPAHASPGPTLRPPASLRFVIHPSAFLILGALVGAAGYLFGTDDGRQRKDDLLRKAKKGADSATDAAGVIITARSTGRPIARKDGHAGTPHTSARRGFTG